MLTEIEVVGPGLWLALSLFVVIRPTATLLALSRVPLSAPQRAFIAWFGVRGVGSIYGPEAPDSGIASWMGVGCVPPPAGGVSR